METNDLLSADEKEALRLTAELANLLHKICFTPERPAGHKRSLEEWKGNQANDWAECAVEIHAIQHRIMAQAAARAYPGEYRLMGSHVGWISETLQSPDDNGTVGA